jgi:hypothetical protein
MRPPRLILATTLVAILTLPGRACGPDYLQMVFVNQNHPDDIRDFVEGRPLLVEREYNVRSLALAYRLLNGPALTPAEKKDVIAFSNKENNGSAWTSNPAAEDFDDAYAAWKKAYTEVAAAPAPDPYRAPQPDPNTSIPGSPWQSYTNCQANAFSTAARTLRARQNQYHDHPAVLQWVSGQDAVFSNCKAPGKQPAALAENAPAWLQKDHAYQIAAAHFYRNEYADAIASFQAIAADRSSPWHDLAGYLVGRTLIRQSSLNDEVTDPAPNLALLEQAEKQMQLVASEKGAYAPAALDALNYIDLHLHPAAAIARMGEQVSRPDPRLALHLYNLHMAYAVYATPGKLPDARADDLIDWIMTMQGDPSVKPAYAIARWRATHRTAWLVAAFATHITTQGPIPDDLLAAAAEVPETSPAWPSLTFYRLAALPPNPANFAELDRDHDTLAAAHALPSTLNAFAELAIQSAPIVQDFARLAPMDPAGALRDGNMMRPLRGPGKDPDYLDDPSNKEIVITMAGLPVNVAGVKRFDDVTATLLNRYLPLSILVPLVLDSPWPRQIRFEAAMAVWTRAVLLNQPRQAAKLTPILAAGEPTWAPYLAAYDASTTTDERRITSLLALLRFPAIRPYVEAGPGREEGMVLYSTLRDNWWCPKLDQFANQTDIFTVQTPIAHPLPPFITPQVAAQAGREEEQLLKIGGAATWFGRQTIASLKARPNDPRNPELLGFAFRAMRNGCDVEDAYTLKRQVYKTLETRYPQSEWAKRWPAIDYQRPF